MRITKFFNCKASIPEDSLENVFSRPVNEDRVRRFVASDDTLDRHSEVVLPEGIKLDNFANAPRLMAFHDWQSSWPIGKITSAGVCEGKLLVDCEFDPPDIDPEADKVLKKIDHGTVNTGSIGFIPTKSLRPEAKDAEDLFTKYPGAERIYVECELLEYSIVPIPANPNAVAASYDEYRKNLNKIKQIDPDSDDESQELAAYLDSRVSLIKKIDDILKG